MHDTRCRVTFPRLCALPLDRALSSKFQPARIRVIIPVTCFTARSAIAKTFSLHTNTHTPATVKKEKGCSPCKFATPGMLSSNIFHKSQYHTTNVIRVTGLRSNVSHSCCIPALHRSCQCIVGDTSVITRPARGSGDEAPRRSSRLSPGP